MVRLRSLPPTGLGGRRRRSLPSPALHRMHTDPSGTFVLMESEFCCRARDRIRYLIPNLICRAVRVYCVRSSPFQARDPGHDQSLQLAHRMPFSTQGSQFWSYACPRHPVQKPEPLWFTEFFDPTVARPTRSVPAHLFGFILWTSHIPI